MSLLLWTPRDQRYVLDYSKEYVYIHIAYISSRNHTHFINQTLFAVYYKETKVPFPFTWTIILHCVCSAFIIGLCVLYIGVDEYMY